MRQIFLISRTPFLIGSPSPAESREITTVPDFAVLRHTAMNDERLSAEALGLLDYVWLGPTRS
jgi:hypothetical protein